MIDQESVTTEVDETVEAAEVEQEVEQEQEFQPEEGKKKISGYIDFDLVKEKLGDDAEPLIHRTKEDWGKIKRLEAKLQREQAEREKLAQELHEKRKPSAPTPPTQDELLGMTEDEAQKRLDDYYAGQQQVDSWNREASQRDQQKRDAEQRAAQEKQTAYAERAKNSQIDLNRLNQAETQIADSLKYNPQAAEIGNFLLGHEFGPQLVDKLATDQAALLEIASLPVYEAVVKLDRISDQFKRKVKTKAPPPDDPLKGNGSLENKSEWLQGATFT
jgi:hypothetical protein